MAREEAAELSAKLDALAAGMKLLLLPRDPLDDKSIMLEIRAGACPPRGRRRFRRLFAFFPHFFRIFGAIFGAPLARSRPSRARAPPLPKQAPAATRRPSGRAT